MDYEGTGEFNTAYTITAKAAFDTAKTAVISSTAASGISMTSALDLAGITIG